MQMNTNIHSLATVTMNQISVTTWEKNFLDDQVSGENTLMSMKVNYYLYLVHFIFFFC